MQTLLIATRNGHKTREIGQMLGSGWQVSDLAALPHAPKIEETGATFEENAALKALAISRIFTGLVLADDSGLEVDALDGAPGVRSARFAGPNAGDAENRFVLIQQLRNLSGTEFSARFRCVMVLASQGALLGSFAGTIEGKVILEERGHADSVMIVYLYLSDTRKHFPNFNPRSRIVLVTVAGLLPKFWSS